MHRGIGAEQERALSGGVFLAHAHYRRRPLRLSREWAQYGVIRRGGRHGGACRERGRHDDGRRGISGSVVERESELIGDPRIAEEAERALAFTGRRLVSRLRVPRPKRGRSGCHLDRQALDTRQGVVARPVQAGRNRRAGIDAQRRCGRVDVI